MSTLSNIFAPDDADQASDETPQSTDGADIAPGTPGYDPDDPSEKPPEVLMPGGPMDPEA